MTDKKIDIDKMIIEDWRNLGFYYDFDDRVSVNQWRVYGDIKGLENFAKIINDYSSNSYYDKLGEHQHIEPYMYLTITTLDKPVITGGCIGGKITDLKYLSGLIKDKLKGSIPGDTFSIDKEYGQNNSATFKFFIMSDNFDPVSMDELIVSNRQEIVNKRKNK